MARIACIMVADFSIAAMVRSNPALEGKVLAIARSLAPHADLDAISVRARELGIRPGMTIAQARAVSSDLIVVHRSNAAESSAHSALLDAAESVSPVVESGPSGCVWLDLAGLNRIYSGEEEIAAELTRCVRRVGMQPAIGIAANNRSIPHSASTNPSAPPIEPSSKLSVRSCRQILFRLAPSAARIASSFWRAVARASNRLATFTHAINNTNATTPSRINSAFL